MSQNFKVKNGLDINGVQVIAANGSLTGPAVTQITNIISSSPTSDDWSRGQANASFAQANTGTVLAQAAFDTANNSTDTWVRTAANSASSYANSSYSQANTATTNAATADQKAVSAGSYANSAYTQANTATTNAATADQRAVTSGSYANSAYGQANTATTNAATADQKAVSAGSYANSAFAQANTALSSIPSLSGYATESYVSTTISNLVDSAPTTLDTLNELAAALGDDANFSTTIATMVGTAGGYANGAYATANLAMSGNFGTYAYADAAFAKANTGTTNAATADQKAVSAGSYANSAFATANVAVSGGVSIYNHAAAAFGKANTVETAVITAGNAAGAAGSYANSAFATANSALEAGNAAISGNLGTYAHAAAAFAKANTALTSVPNSSTQVSSLGVGTAASGTTGEIRATDDITAFYSSDNRLKENIQDVSNALDKVCAIGSKTYDWKDEHISRKGGEDGYFVRKSDFGVIAQDVEAVFPQAVRTREDGTKVVDYEKLGTLAFGAIKELVIRIEALEAK